MLRTLFQSRQLTGIVAMLSLTMVVTTFVDVQFKAVSAEAFPEAADLTAFWVGSAVVSVWFPCCFNPS